jgi:glycosyltransferase involved in cell wall biosynthesis
MLTPEKEEIYFKHGKYLSRKILFPGKLTHKSLKNILARSDILIAPSLLPESFGMVAIEALASGVIPMMAIPGHSGFQDIINLLSPLLPTEIRTCIQLNSSDKNFVNELVNKTLILTKYLSNKDASLSVKKTCRNLACKMYSWESISKSIKNIINFSFSMDKIIFSPI